MTAKEIFDNLIELFRKDSVYHSNMVLPAAHLRFCGKEFKDDRHFLKSARKEAERLVRLCGLSASSRVLDIGCGPGRLPIGILSNVGEIRQYSGFDVDALSIKWGRRYITSKHPSFQFTHIDVNNDRYNPGGSKIDRTFRFPFRDQEFDIIYLYSVFSHMIEEDVRVYLREFRRLLTPMGKVFLTGFIEGGVAEMAVNPSGYRSNWQGALHCVRYDKAHFESLLDENDFKVDRFEHETETDGQSAVYLSTKKKAA